MTATPSGGSPDMEAARQADHYRRQLEAVCNNATVAMFIMDDHQFCTYMNPAAERLIGYTLEEARGRPLHDVVHHTRPDGTPYPLAECPIDRAFPDRNLVQGEETFVHRDGHFYPVAFTASPIREGEATIGTIIEVRDLAADKRAKAELMERELRYQLVADASNDAIWDWNLQTNQIAWNEGVRSRFGYASDQVSTEGSWWVEHIHPEDRDRVARGIYHQIEHGPDQWRDEYRFQRGDGSYAVVFDRGQVVRNALGKAVRMVGSMLDLTERRAAEAALRAAEERFTFVRRSSGVGFWYCDLPFETLEWDELVKEHFHLPPDARVTLDTFYAQIHPDDREPTRKAIDHSINNQAAYDVHFRTVNPETGDEKWVRAIGRTSYDADGTPRRFDGVTIDATAQVRAEHALRDQELRFRLLADSIDQMVWVARPGGDHEYHNKRWYDYTGVPQGATDGQGWLDVFHPEDQAKARERWTSSLATGQPYEAESRMKHQTGEYRWVLGRALPQRADDGSILKWFGTCTDIHDQKQAAQERENLLRQAEIANRMKDEFLATLSHELRTPLNAIVGWTHILQTGPTDPDDLKEGLEVIDRNARAQAQLIEDLLDISRIISGKLTLDVQRLNLVEVIEAALDSVAHAAEARGIRVHKVLDSLAGPVSGDSTRLQQVVWNLIANAIKFTPKGGKVQVLLERVNSHVEISIIDTGIGIKPEFLPHVFDRFRQADGSTTRRHGGLGLGLSIVKQLVEMHGGSVRVKSPGEGQGSTFVVALPITVVHPEQTSHAKPRSSSGQPDGEDACGNNDLKGLRILVVDDEADARKLVKRVLSDCGARIELAGSAAEALDLIETTPLNLIVSDVGMPEQDGYDLMRQVRKRFSARVLPAVALSAFARSEDRTRALRAGFQVHAAKPIDPSELVALVASLAGRTGEGGDG